MYYIHKTPQGRLDPITSREAATFTGHPDDKSPWQYQADFVDKRAMAHVRRIAPRCPFDALYHARPLALVPWVGKELEELAAYEYRGNHGLFEYCWMERHEAQEGTKFNMTNGTIYQHPSASGYKPSGLSAQNTSWQTLLHRSAPLAGYSTGSTQAGQPVLSAHQCPIDILETFRIPSVPRPTLSTHLLSVNGILDTQSLEQPYVASQFLEQMTGNFVRYM